MLGERSRAGGGADVREITYDSHDAFFFFFPQKGKKKKCDGCCEVTGRDTWVLEPEQEVKAKASRPERSSRCIRLSASKVRVAACLYLGLELSAVLGVSCGRRHRAPALQRIVRRCPFFGIESFLSCLGLHLSK